MIDHQRRLIFIHIARTGGTSIETACVGGDWFRIDRATKHLSASQAHQLYGDQIWGEYTTFSVVRNPWDRVVSMWNTGWWHKAIVDSGGKRPETLYDLLINFVPHPNEIYRSRLYHEILDDRIDFILRFESLQRDFEQMFADLGHSRVELPVIEKRERRNYREYYDCKSRDLVAEIYHREIERFAYEF